MLESNLLSVKVPGTMKGAATRHCETGSLTGHYVKVQLTGLCMRCDVRGQSFR